MVGAWLTASPDGTKVFVAAAWVQSVRYPTTSEATSGIGAVLHMSGRDQMVQEQADNVAQAIFGPDV